MSKLTDLFSDSMLPLLAVTALSAFLEYLLPEGSDSRMAASLRLVTGLCVLLALAAPLRDAAALIGSLDDDPDGAFPYARSPDAAVTPGEEYLNGYLTAQSADAVEAWAIRVLGERFGIAEEDCRVAAEVGPGTMDASVPDADVTGFCVRRLDVVLSGRAILRDPHVIEDWFERETGCVCRVTVE